MAGRQLRCSSSLEACREKPLWIPTCGRIVWRHTRQLLLGPWLPSGLIAIVLIHCDFCLWSSTLLPFLQLHQTRSNLLCRWDPRVRVLSYLSPFLHGALFAITNPLPWTRVPIQKPLDARGSRGPATGVAVKRLVYLSPVETISPEHAPHLLYTGSDMEW